MTLKLATNTTPLEEATAWRVALTENDVDTTRDFERWLANDPANAAAWAQVQSSWALIDKHKNDERLDSMRRDALLRAGAAKRDRQTRRVRIAAMAACLLVALATLVTLNTQLSPWGGGTTYTTALAERRVITLDDSSKLSLDSGSEVAVDYSADARKLVLVHGQAKFDVAHDPLRPFTVQAGDKLVVATGTSFTVDMNNGQVTVTLLEGKVSVLSLKSPKAKAPQAVKEVSIVQGQQVEADIGQTSLDVAQANVDKATAWEQGLLMFDDETLASVAQRVSRYSSRKVVVDASVADMKISGVFKAGDTRTFVDAVSSYLPVKAENAGPEEVRLVKRI